MASDKSLEDRLLVFGHSLGSRPYSVDELYSLLDQIDSLLSRVEQSPSSSTLTALQPLMKELAVKELLGHSDMDVKAAVASCISEITRITAPEAPYEDDIMKEIFQMIVGVFETLHDTSSRSFQKRVSVLETVAKVRSCVVMLDLECDLLILEMFQHFLKTIRDDHSDNVLSSMETIMILVIEESEDISSDILSCLLDTVKHDNKDVLPIARTLVEKVMSNCAIKIKPCLLEFVQSTGAIFNEYSEVVASICQGSSEALDHSEPYGSGEVLDCVLAEITDVQACHFPQVDDSKLSERTVSDELPQASPKMEQEVGCPENVDAAANTPAVTATTNGTVQMGNGDSMEQPSSPKQKSERSRRNGQSKNAIADCMNGDNLDTVAEKQDGTTDLMKAIGLKTNNSLQLTDTTDHFRVDSNRDASTVTSGRRGHAKNAVSSSDKNVEATNTLEPEEKEEIEEHPASSNPTSDASPTHIENAVNPIRTKRGRPPSKAVAKQREVNAVAEKPASASGAKDSLARSQTDTVEPEEEEIEEHPASDNPTSDTSPTHIESPVNPVRTKRGRPPSKAVAKQREINAVPEKPASASGGKDSLARSQTDTLEPEEEEIEEHPASDNPTSDPLPIPMEIPMNPVRTKRGRPPSKAVAKRRDFNVVAEKPVSASREKDSLARSQTDTLEPEEEEIEEHPTSDNLASDASQTHIESPVNPVRTKRGRPPSKAVAKQREVNAVAEKPASVSGEKDSLAKGRTDTLEPEDAEGIEEHPASDKPTADASPINLEIPVNPVRTKRGRPPSKAVAKRKDVNVVAEKPASASRENDSLARSQTDILEPEEKEEIEEHPASDNPTSDASPIPMETPMNPVRTKRGRPPSKAVAKQRDVNAVAEKHASASGGKDSLARSLTDVVKDEDSQKDTDAPAGNKTPTTVMSESEMKPQKNSAKSSGRKRKGIKQQNEDSTGGKDVSGEPSLKEIASSLRPASEFHSGNQTNTEDSVKRKSGRKRVRDIEYTSETPDSKKEIGMDLVGLKIKVWWPDDQMFYRGTVEEFDAVTKKHMVLYDDGDIEILLLKDERWEFADIDTENEEINQTEAGIASQTPLLKKSKSSSNALLEATRSSAKTKSGTESSGNIIRGRGRPRTAASSLGKVLHDDSPMTSTKRKGNYSSDLKAAAPKSRSEDKDLLEREAGGGTPGTSTEQEEPSDRSKDEVDTPKTLEKSKDESRRRGRPKKGTPDLSSKSKVDKSTISGKSEDGARKRGRKPKEGTPNASNNLKDDTPKNFAGKSEESTPKTSSKSEEVFRRRGASKTKSKTDSTSKTSGDLKENGISSKGKTNINESPATTGLDDSEATTGGTEGRKRKRKGRK